MDWSSIQLLFGAAPENNELFFSRFMLVPDYVYDVLVHMSHLLEPLFPDAMSLHGSLSLDMSIVRALAQETISRLFPRCFSFPFLLWFWGNEPTFVILNCFLS